MGRIQVDITDDLESRFRATVLRKYKKHQIKPYIEAALSEWIARQEVQKQPTEVKK